MEDINRTGAEKYSEALDSFNTVKDINDIVGSMASDMDDCDDFIYIIDKYNLNTHSDVDNDIVLMKTLEHHFKEICKATVEYESPDFVPIESGGTLYKRSKELKYKIDADVYKQITGITSSHEAFRRIVIDLGFFVSEYRMFKKKDDFHISHQMIGSFDFKTRKECFYVSIKYYDEKDTEEVPPPPPMEVDDDDDVSMEMAEIEFEPEIDEELEEAINFVNALLN